MSQEKVNVEQLADEVYKLMQAEVRKGRSRGQTVKTMAATTPGKRR